jgi:hypothetical protein
MLNTFNNPFNNIKSLRNEAAQDLVTVALRQVVQL